MISPPGSFFWKALDVQVLHSTVALEEQLRVFSQPERGRRKVILATNIAESSITVRDVSLIIDSWSVLLRANVLSCTDRCELCLL